MDTETTSIKKIVGGGYDEFWNFKGRYRLVKGGRGSKKSTTTALWYIFNMMYYYYKYGVKPNVLVIRAFKVDHLDTTFAQLQWAINTLGVEKLWSSSKLPMSFTFLPSGQRIIFRGMDKAERIKSTTTAVGHLCWVWWEEAFEIPFFKDVQTINFSIRGKLPEPLFYQNTFTFNPNVADHWLKREFYDLVDKDTGMSEDGAILAITRNFDCNEFLDDNFLAEMERLRLRDPEKYKIVAMGEWGMSSGIIYRNWSVVALDWQTFRIHQTPWGSADWEYRYGIDFGFTESPTALVVLAVNKKERIIRVLETRYLYGKIASEIAQECTSLGLKHAHWIADSSHKMAIEEMSRYGMTAIEPTAKGNGSVVVGIERVKEYRIEIDHHNTKFIEEIREYRWKEGDREDSYCDEPAPGQSDHGLDAMRYAMEQDGMWDFKRARQLQHFYCGRRKEHVDYM